MFDTSVSVDTNAQKEVFLQNILLYKKNWNGEQKNKNKRQGNGIKVRQTWRRNKSSKKQ